MVVRHEWHGRLEALVDEDLHARMLAQGKESGQSF